MIGKSTNVDALDTAIAEQRFHKIGIVLGDLVPYNICDIG